MSNQSRNLGRGLSSLLSSGLHPHPVSTAEATSQRTLPLDAIQAGAAQPRQTMHQQPLEELAASIKASGVIQPIIVRRLKVAPTGAPGYEIVAGERRWRASKLAGLTEMPVVVRECSDEEAVAIALIENIQREDLTPAEEARALQRLAAEFQLTHQAVADAVGRSRAAVSNLIRILDLPAEVVALVDAKALGMGHARALLGLANDAERIRLARLVAERNLSVRATEALVRKLLAGEGRAPPSTPPDLSVLSEVMRTSAARVQLQQKSAGNGKLIVDFADTGVRDALVTAIKTVLGS